jgi:AraC-like DNA-binding protein
MPDPSITLARHETELAWWEMANRPPSARLRGFVAGLCDYREATAMPLRRREVPCPTVTLILSFGEPLRVLPGAASFTSFVAGLHDRPVTISHDGRQRGIQVDLTPLGAFALLGVPMHELANRVVPLGELLDRDAESLVERLAATRGQAARFEILETALAARMATGPGIAPEVGAAWRLLERSDGLVPVARLAGEVGWSRRHLVDRFREQVGLPPKVAARVLRFQRAAGLITGGARSWADVALTCGYYDQAHLNRDFRALAGCTPGAYLAAMLPDCGGFSDGDESQLPFVQDGARLAG